MAKRRMHLGFDFSYSHMGGRWRMPGAWPGHTFPDVAMFEEMARIAERGLLDIVFSGDGTGVPDTWRGSRDAAVEWGMNWPRQDLTPYAVAMARVTKHVGYGLTFSSTFLHPYYCARLLNSLDHITGGRIAMNLVASTRLSDHANYGHDELPDHNARYDRMEEFTDVLRLLWDSVDPDAMLWDRATGRVGDPAKLRDVRHAGRFFKVTGPLNTPPSPQGRPVLIQAGGSPRGIRASAHVADHVFGGDMDLSLQVRQRAALDEALRAIGRDPEQVGILWQTPIVVAETEREALARRDLLLTSIPPEAVGAYLSYNAGYDFSTLPARFTLQELHAEIIAGQASPMGFLKELSVRLGEDAELTREEFFEHGLREATVYDRTLAGSPAQLADRLEELFEATGSRGGFMLGHTVAMPPDLVGIADLLVPELQRRGRFRREYRYHTLKENLADS
ncbi:NtaA/DmoA family FMN-dependent monooxygenase [Paracraurococcus ruber]|uniref:Methylene-tetrahydromethanopterin reductase n=1 Tax=Paracraurococcus ruber TaxID=77675 RepID=A0ABS1CT27_9PROT|nr:NtaA/DmoA family FMN-dependent monooxygenase [Paracraurococcus ruber]MBK1657629.1 methylene-tetrahydromethanopterin reductase [Paracraurococcus ruber]TDG34212.1 LLM class flavin-dependent oxidoreductase [Paracraurococcus ruber]